MWRATDETSEFSRVSSEPVPGRDGNYSFVDAAVTSGATYFYRLEALSSSGQARLFGPISVTVAQPREIVLDQNVPNPFNPSTRIAYQVPFAARVRLTVYNMLGQEIRSLVDDSRTPGYYQAVWNGLTDRGSPAASGIYFARLQVVPKDAAAERRSASRIIRMLMVR